MNGNRSAEEEPGCSEDRAASVRRPLLSVEGLQVVYDRIIVGLRGVSLEVEAGQVVVLLGANGAGKSTALKGIAGLLPAEGGAIAEGEIVYDGAVVTGSPARLLVRRGLIQVLEGRHCFPHLTVEENLVSGAISRRVRKSQFRQELDRIYGYFPQLATLRKQRCGFASGGEQQMVAIGRALLANPRLVLLDEPSMGLAPQVVEEIFQIVRSLNRNEGVSFLLAEQNAHMALRHADHGYVLENGRVVLSGSAFDLGNRSDIQSFYLGLGASAGGRGQDGASVAST
jgi:branched-chain amino acid transport system ATP-binding protein